MNKKCYIILLLLFSVYFYGYEIQNTKIGYIVDLPENWKVLDSENLSLVTFADSTQNATFQVFSFKKEVFNNSSEILNYIKKTLSAEGEQESFYYMGQESIFADLTFNTKSFKVRGYCVLINGNQYDYVLLASSNIEYYEQFHDYLLSCIDSFSLSAEEKFYPGPVSQYYNAFPAKNNAVKNLFINNKSINFNYNIKDIETADFVIQREAGILAQEKNEYYNSWMRYYRMIYRDNCYRLKEFSNSLSKIMNKSSISDIKNLISWIQSFSFNRTNNIADFTSPIELITSQAGDCDSRVILLSIILNQIGIDSIALVSVIYSHSLIGIDINYEGKKMLYNNKNYLLVELTAKREIGVLDDNVSNLDNWFPMKIY